MKAVIYPNFRKQNALEATRTVCQILQKLQMDVAADAQYRSELGSVSGMQFGDFETLAADADFAIAIGGDGTILKCAGKLLYSSAKLLGINTGRLGFMAALERHELLMLSRLLTGDYAISERMMLRAEIKGAGQSQVFHALNDVYASRLSGNICDFSVYVDDCLIGQYRADGVVFSTPTGSTAYALSAGGPIVEPELRCIEMALVCPHSLSTRPMLFSTKRHIRLVHSGEDKPVLYITVDGKEPVVLQIGQSLELSQSVHTIRLIDMHNTTFYDSLNGKLMQSIQDLGGRQP